MSLGQKYPKMGATFIQMKPDATVNPKLQNQVNINTNVEKTYKEEFDTTR